MSGIIGAALIAGNALKNFLFNYTKNEYEQKIGELDGLITKLNTHLDNLTSLRNQVPGFWEDEKAQATVRTLDVNIQKVRRNMETAKALSDTFKKTVSELDGSQNVLGGLIEDAQGILNSIGE